MAEYNLQKMNLHFGTLADAEKNTAKKEHKYSEMLTVNKGSTQEKILESQLITRFFKYFPNLASRALDAQLDLCKDEDICVRIQAIRDLPVLCKENKEYVTRIAHVLSQLLFTDDPQELMTVQGVLLSLVKIDAKGVLTEIFHQIQSNVEVVRERSMKFIMNEVMALGAEIIENDVEDLIISECKNVIRNATCEEFQILMMILSSTRLNNTEDGHKELVELLASKAELDQYFNPDDINQVNRLTTCLNLAIPFFSARVESTKFIVYLCDLLNRYIRIKDNDKQFIILKSLAESVPYCGKLINPEATVEQVYQAVLDLVTVPEKDDNMKIKNIDLHRVEALLYAFHILGKQRPYFLSEIFERQKELNRMFLCIGTFTRKFLAITRKELKGKYAENVKNDPIVENKLKDLRSARNINTLIRRLFNVAPRMETTIDPLSWLGRDTRSILAKIFWDDKEHKPRTVDVSSRTIDRSNNSRRPPLKDEFGGESSNNITNRLGEGGSVGRNARRSKNRWNRWSWKPY